MIGTTEILVIVGVLVLLFGATAIPKLARSIGKARAEFDQGLTEGKEGREGKRGTSEGTSEEEGADGTNTVKKTGENT